MNLSKILRMSKRAMAVAAVRVITEANHRQELMMGHSLIPQPGEIARPREFTEEQIKNSQILRIGHSFLETELAKFPLSFLKGILRPKLNRVIEHKIIVERIRESQTKGRC